MSDFVKITEQSSLYNNLEKKDVGTILKEINQEDHKIADAVEKTLPIIEQLVEEMIPRLERGGRIFYIGAGTSGRIGVLDASEIPPTFGMPPTLFIGLIAGGDVALRNPVENAEDTEEMAWHDLQEHRINENDTVIGIAASGTTPYVVAGIREARKRGILTAGVTSNPGSPVALAADHAIVTVVGPEYVTGSSRMKSGTAQKLVLNMISTTLMIKTGRVEGNKMVNMQLSNKKLVERGTNILVERLGLNPELARRELLEAGSVRAVLDKYES
ncbi:MAG: N-acetylmuramic acid 6-phosphate etherase [Porphyromonas sp.]|nr:N-acetylmuramic acid 6-phosphate etherase [Porphyromonas sp.]